jgi:hypothetical protein
MRLIAELLADPVFRHVLRENHRLLMEIRAQRRANQSKENPK